MLIVEYNWGFTIGFAKHIFFGIEGFLEMKWVNFCMKLNKNIKADRYFPIRPVKDVCEEKTDIMKTTWDENIFITNYSTQVKYTFRRLKYIILAVLLYYLTQSHVLRHWFNTSDLWWRNTKTPSSIPTDTNMFSDYYHRNINHLIRTIPDWFYLCPISLSPTSYPQGPESWDMNSCLTQYSCLKNWRIRAICTLKRPRDQIIAMFSASETAGDQML